MTLAIREYSPDSMRDYEWLRRVIQKLLEHTAALDPMQRVRVLPYLIHREVAQLLQMQSQGGQIFVAEYGDTPVGLLAASVNEGNKYVGEVCEGVVATLFVAADHRGTGLGTALMAHAETWFKERGCTAVWVTTNAFNAAACKFYDRRGYLPREVALLKPL